jgi:rhodanese-related sulfurtransferase
MKRVQALLAEATSAVATIAAKDTLQLWNGPDVAFIDLRESNELEDQGMIPGAVHAPRGLLEFLIDPASMDHNPIFSAKKKFIFYCASGGRSALAASTAQHMGLERVFHMAGGLHAWIERGGPVGPLVVTR